MRLPTLFIPLGLMASVLGVSLWPLYHFGALPFYPGLVHARLMIEGFAAAFLIGLTLGKAGRGLVLPWLAAMGFHATGHLVLGDGCFFLFLGAAAISTVLQPRGPDRVTWLLALSSGMAGLGLSLALATGNLPFQLETYRLGNLLLNQGFPVLGLLAISENRSSQPRPWLTAILGLGVLIALLWESRGAAREAAMIKLALVGTFAVLFRPDVAGTLGMAWRVGLLVLALGLGLAAGMPAANQVVSVTHVAFLGGYGLVLLSVGARETAGRRWVWWMMGLVLVGAATRAPADFVPRITVTHHFYAAILWIAAVAVWVWKGRRRSTDRLAGRSARDGT